MSLDVSTLFRASIAWFLALAIASVEAPVEAQRPEGSPLVVLPTMAEGARDSVPEWTAPLIERELAQRGTPTLRPYEAADRFARNHSAEPMDHERGALERLHACAERSLYTVATGQYRQARANAAECVDEAERALESINRESAAAEDVLNSCLYVVRALIAMRQTAAAREETIRCRVMVPDLTPRGTRHPPEVVSLVRRVDLELAEMAQRLVVETSEPGCGVYINGRRLGSTPLTLDSLHAATYRVQVECDPDVPGRVHEIELTEPAQRVFVDSRFETVVRTRRGPGHRDGSIELHYDTRVDEARLRLADGVRTGRLLEAREVWLVERETTGFVRVDRVDVGSGRVLASGRLALEPDAQGFRGHALGEVIVAMASGHSLDASGDRTARMSAWVPPLDAEATTASASGRASPQIGRASVEGSSSRSLGRPRRVALGLGVTGLAATAGGWGIWLFRYLREDPFEDSAWKFPQLSGLGAGAGLLTASLPFWLPERERTPRWAWAAGAVGLGAVAAGAFIEATEERGGLNANGEILPTRTRFEAGYGIMLVAAPLISVPITYLARGRAELTVSTGAGGAIRASAIGRF